MSIRILAVLAVSIVSGCGAGAQAAPASQASVRTVAESNTSDDYVVGPFVTHADGSDHGDQATRTYYIVRN